MIMYKL